MPPADIWDDEGRLRVNAAVRIPASELTVRATRAGGPGGQHVNTSSTRVEVVWNARQSVALTEAQRARLELRLASKLDASGALRVVAADTRSQSQNRGLALARLAGRGGVGRAGPSVRRGTTRRGSAPEARRGEKTRRAHVKRDRRWRGED